jgi:hypothetical protein
MAIWQNRQSGNPGRYLITPELGGAAYFATLQLADNPIVEGTPEVVETFLKAATSMLYGFSDPTQATPDDVFSKIYQLNLTNSNATAGVRTDLTAEIAARKAADTTLQTNIDNISSTISGDYTALTDAITAETNARTTADEVLQGNINLLRTDSEGKIATLTTNLTAEVTRATGKENELQTLITNNYTALDTRITANAAKITDNYTTLDGRVTANAGAISAETAARQLADTALQSAIDTEHADMIARVTANATAIAMEQTNRTNADTTLQNNINALGTIVDGNLTNTNSAITAETARAKAEELRIDGKVDDLTATVSNNNTALQTAINTETSRATNAENALQTAVGTKQNTIIAGTTSQYWRGDKTWRNFAPDVRNTQLTGIVFSDGSAVTATDTVSGAFGKSQKHLETLDANLATEITNRINNDMAGVSLDEDTFEVTFTKNDASTYKIQIPFANEQNNGIIAPSTYMQIFNNLSSINAMRNGLWVRGNLGYNPTQATLNTTWLSIMGGSEVPIGARVTNEDENVPNGADYFYTASSSGNSWVLKTISTSPTFTNNFAGIIQGSLLDGEVQATPYGTGAVTGWKTALNRITLLESNRVVKTDSISITGPDVSAAGVQYGTGAILQSILSDTGIAAGSYGVDADTAIDDGGDFTALGMTVDAKGRIRNISNCTMTLTAARNGVLTGFSASTGTTVPTDTIIGSLQKHEGNINALTTNVADREPAITAGTTSQYYRGDKTWQSFNTAVRNASLTGLANVESAAILATDNVLAAFGKAQAHLTALDTAVAGKEPTITAGTAQQYWRGDKTWSAFGTDVLATTLSAISLTDVTDVTALDNILTAFGKLQAQVNRADTNIGARQLTIPTGFTTQYFRGDHTWSTLETAVTASKLTGLVASTNAAIAAGDTVLTAFGKAQAHLTALDTAVAAAQGQINGTGFVKANGTTLTYDNSTYVKDTDLATTLSNTINGSALSAPSATWYGVSSTAAATAQKEVTISNITTLNAGTVIWVKVVATNTAESPTLKLNSFQAYPIRYNGRSMFPGDGSTWKANVVTAFVFDGTNWNAVGTDENYTYSAITSADIIKGTNNASQSVRADYLKAGILGTILTGFSVPASNILSANDSILGAFGKLQAQINATKALTPFSTGNYDGEFSPVPGALTSGIATTDIIIVYGTIQNGMQLIDNNGNVGILSNYVSSSNTGNITTIAKGLENVPVLIQADPNNYGVVAIYITAEGSGYAPGEEFTVNGVTGTINAVSQTGGLSTGNISWDFNAKYSDNKEGTGFSVTATTGSGATATIVTAYATGTERVIGNLEHQTADDPLISSSRLRAFWQEQLPIGGKQIGKKSIWGEHFSDGCIQGAGVTRDSAGNYIIAGGGGGGGNSVQVTTPVDEQAQTLVHTFTTYVQGSTMNVEVDWGDGTVTEYDNVDPSVQFTQEHTYAVAGTYDITVTQKHVAPDPLPAGTFEIRSDDEGVVRLWMKPNGKDWHYKITLSVGNEKLVIDTKAPLHSGAYGGGINSPFYSIMGVTANTTFVVTIEEL